MKKILSIICLSLAFLMKINLANATIVVIQAVGNSNQAQYFSPQVANANTGDTIKWVNVSGTHTAASTIIPSGAAPWDSGNLTTLGFMYVVTVPGTYNYTCHPATGGHMDASFVVTTSTNDVPSINSTNYGSLAYPNPCSDKITIEAPFAEIISVYNVMGQKMKSVAVKNQETKVEVDVADLTEGIYFYSIIKEGVIVETRKLVKK